MLLTAYADTEAAIHSINRLALDYYLMKPWDPPEENLYPVLDDLLADWQSQRPPALRRHPRARRALVAPFPCREGFPGPPPDRLPVAGRRDGIPRGAPLVDELVPAPPELPVVLFPDGSVLIEPTLRQTGREDRDAAPGCRRQHYESDHHRRRSRWSFRGGIWRFRRTKRAGDRTRTRRVVRLATAPRSRITWDFPSVSRAWTWRAAALTQAKRFGAEILSATEVSK